MLSLVNMISQNTFYKQKQVSASAASVFFSSCLPAFMFSFSFFPICHSNYASSQIVFVRLTSTGGFLFFVLCRVMAEQSCVSANGSEKNFLHVSAKAWLWTGLWLFKSASVCMQNDFTNFLWPSKNRLVC